MDKSASSTATMTKFDSQFPVLFTSHLLSSVLPVSRQLTTVKQALHVTASNSTMFFTLLQA
jgi:hypothetical protein